MISEVFKNKTNTQDIRMPVVLEIFGGYLDEFYNLLNNDINKGKQ